MVVGRGTNQEDINWGNYNEWRVCNRLDYVAEAPLATSYTGNVTVKVPSGYSTLFSLNETNTGATTRT